MAKNNNLHSAKRNKKDEFYTQLADIERELMHYKYFFKGKVVYCNCDDARESNFFRYFSMNFEHLGLKKLISTGYKDNGKGVLLTYEGDINGNRIVDNEEIVVTELNGDGDFRSEECIEFLKEADVVVTNPPFSLFREYVAQLMEYGKKFLILGNNNAINDMDIFPLFKSNQIWYGYNTNKTLEFSMPMNYEKWQRIEGNRKYGKVPAISWFTNIEHKKRNQPLDLYKKYSNEYPKYDNYDAIEVSKVADIPMDYNGVCGVPITFMNVYCPSQFEIIGISDRHNSSGLRTKVYTNEDMPKANDYNRTPCIKTENGYKSLYMRLFIRKINY